MYVHFLQPYIRTNPYSYLILITFYLACLTLPILTYQPYLTLP